MRLFLMAACFAERVMALQPLSAAMLRSPVSQSLRTGRLSAQVAQDGWITEVDECGRAYYVNQQTGQAQWEPPRAVAAQTLWRIDALNGVAGFSGVAGFAAQSKYTFATLEYAREGRPCQLPYNLGVGDERALSRWNMVEQKLSVSTKQCVVSCLKDGTLALTSEGKSPTLWCAPGGQWNALYQDETQALVDGALVSLDCDDAEAAVFVCEAVGSDEQQQYGNEQAQPLYVEALSDYAAQQEDDLAFRAGDVIQVTQQGEPGGYWAGSLNGQGGWFPSNLCSEPWS
jgi:hypothetical protein